MRNLGLEYPQYGFGDHVGYATVAHRRALASAARARAGRPVADVIFARSALEAESCFLSAS